MSITYWVTLTLSVVSLTVCYRVLLRTVSQYKNNRYTSTDMRIAYLKGFEDAVMKRKCKSERALSEYELGVEVDE